MLDDSGRERVFRFLKAAGYSGTMQQWWATMEQQSYSSDNRIFGKIHLAQLGRKFFHAQDFVRKVLARVQPRFDRVHLSNNRSLAISFSNSGARLQETPSKPLRIDGFALDVEQRGQLVQVRCRFYANSLLRRDCNFDFSELPAKNCVGGSK